MKLNYTAVLLATLCVSAVAGSSAFALTQDASQPSAGAAMRTPEQVVDTLAAKLNLSDDQKAKIQPVIADRQQKLAALKSDTSMRPMQKKRKLKSIFEESDKKIKAVLNDQQKQQYAQLEQEMREQRKERMQSRGSSN